MSVPKCVGVLHILIYGTVPSVSRVHNAVNNQGDIHHIRNTFALYRLQQPFCLLGLFIETAFLLSSVGCINNSSIFCILSALYIFILWACQHDVWEWKVCGPFLSCKKATKCFSILRRYCLTVCSEKGVLLGSISVFCTLQLLQWKPLSTPAAVHITRMHAHK